MLTRIHLAQIYYNPAYYEAPVNYLEEPSFSEGSQTPIGPLRTTKKIEEYLVNSEGSYNKYFERKLYNILKWSGERGANIVAFPEYAIPAHFLKLVKDLSLQYGFAVAAGTHKVRLNDPSKTIYQDIGIPPERILVGSACAPVFFPDKTIKIARKLKKSKWEPNLNVPEEDPIIMQLPVGDSNLRLSVVPCIDSISLDVLGKLKNSALGLPNIIICPSLSPTISPFQDLGSLARLEETLFCYVNTSLYGGTSFNIPNDWEAYLCGPNYGNKHLPKYTEGILEIDFDHKSLFLKRGSAKTSPICKHPIVFPIVYTQSSPWLTELNEVKQVLMDTLKSGDVKFANDLMDDFLADYSQSLPDLLLKNLKDLRHSLLPLYGGDAKSIEDASSVIEIGGQLEDTPHFMANRVNSALKLLSECIIEAQTEDTENILKCIESLKGCQSKLPVISDSDSIKKENEIKYSTTSMDFAGQEDLVTSFQNRGPDVEQIRNFFANKNNRVVIVTGSLGIGKSSFIDWMFQKAFGDWTMMRVHIPPEARFPRVISDIAYKLGVFFDTDTLSFLSHKIFRQKVRKLLSEFYSKPKRALVIDDLFHIFRQKNARDYKQLSIFFEESAKAKATIGGRIFFVSSSWVPEKWLHSSGVSHMQLRKLIDVYVRRIIEYQIRRLRLVQEETVPEPSQTLLNLINGHPLSAKLVIDALDEQGFSGLNDQLSLAKITGHLAKELLKHVHLTPHEFETIKKISIFRNPVSTRWLEETDDINLDHEGVVNLVNRCIIDYDGQKMQLHEAVRRFFYSQIDELELESYHRIAVSYYQESYDKQRYSGKGINPSIVGELAHHLSLSGDISKLEDIRLFVVNEIKPAAKKVYKEYRKYEKALSLYQIASSIVPDDHEVWAYIGRCYARLGLWKDSDASFQKALDVVRRSGSIPWWIYRDWGHIRARYQFYTIAEDLFLKAASYVSKDSSISASLAYMRWQQGDIDVACELFEEALNINSHHEYSLIYYSKLLNSIGDHSYADILQERLNSLDPILRYQEPNEYEIEIDDDCEININIG